MSQDELRIYNAILEAGLCSMESLDLALFIGGDTMNTLNGVVLYYTGYQTWEDYESE